MSECEFELPTPEELAEADSQAAEFLRRIAEATSEGAQVPNESQKFQGTIGDEVIGSVDTDGA